MSKGKNKEQQNKRHVNYGDKALGLDNSNYVENGVPNVYREYQDDISSSVDPILRDDEDAASKFTLTTTSINSTRKSIATHQRLIVNPYQVKYTQGKRKSHDMSHDTGGRKSMASVKPIGHTSINMGNHHHHHKAKSLKSSFSSRQFRGEREIVDKLRILETKSRIFLRRDPIVGSNFDILDEDGRKMFQLNDITKEVVLPIPIHYTLMDKDNKTELLILKGTYGFLGFNGEIVAEYPKSEIFGRCVQRTMSCSCYPKVYILDEDTEEVSYELNDKNKYKCVFCLCRSCQPSVYELVKSGGLPVVHGRIDERRLIVPEGGGPTKSKVLKTGRRSIPAAAGGTGRLSISLGKDRRISTNEALLTMESGGGQLDSLFKPMGRKSFGQQNQKRRSSETQKALLVGAGILEEKSLMNPKEAAAVGGGAVPLEPTSHENFAIGFSDSLTYHTRVMMIVAHLLVNDDYVRKTKTVTRSCFVITLLLIVSLLIIGLIAIIIWQSLK